MVLAIASNLSWVGPSTCKRYSISCNNTSIIGNRNRERKSTIHQVEVSTDEARKMRTYTWILFDVLRFEVSQIVNENVISTIECHLARRKC